MPQEEGLGALVVREDVGRALIYEGVVTFIGAAGLDIQFALMGIDIGLRGGAGDGRDKGSHAHDSTGRARGTGVNPAFLAEGFGEGLGHGAGNLGVLLPAHGREVSHPVFHGFPEIFQLREQLLAIRGQVVGFGTVAEHLQEDGIGFFCVGKAGAVAAVMAHIGGFIALGSGRGGFGLPVHHGIQAGSLVPVGTHLGANLVGRRRCLGRLHDDKVRIERPLETLGCGLVAGGLVHPVGGLIPFPAHAERGGAAAIHIEGIARMEVPLQETGELPGRHAFAHAGLTAIHDHHDEVVVGREGDRRTGMTDTLVTDGILVIVLGELLGREGAVHKEGAHRVEVVDEHGRAGEDVLPG